MRVGFVFTGSPANHSWIGGANYYKNLFLAMATVPKPGIEAVAFVPPGQKWPFSPLKSNPIPTSLVKPKTLPWLMRYGVRTITSRDWIFEALLQRHDIDTLSHAQHLGKGASIATLGWIPDFQHLHLPQFFSRKRRLELDRYFTRLCEKCDYIIVSSKCAEADLKSFAPQYSSKARVLHFVSAAPSPASLPSLSDLQSRYSFSCPYFILPNQFWAHKNHRVVIDALRILKRQGRSYLVLATGSTSDLRHPDLFSSLLSRVKDNDLLDVFRVLGVIPYHDVSALMTHSVAFINPSFFEGWSTSVEESKSLGKQIILSDIPVHREQNPIFGTYFDPSRGEDLAVKLRSCYEAFDQTKDLEGQLQAARDLTDRQRQFAESYQEIVLSTKRR